jgi:serine phosphatase RsbU (regulator of sigma subunit)
MCHTLRVDDDLVGPPLGNMEQAEYGAAQESVQIGDLFLVYTDGLFEVFNSQKEIYGRPRLIIVTFRIMFRLQLMK